MVDKVTSYIVDNDRAFEMSLDRLSKTVSDFRIPFGLIAKDFYRGNKKIFKLKSPGKYPDFGGFNPNEIPEGRSETRRVLAKRQKLRDVSFIYPMLVRSGRLAASLVSPNSGDSIRAISKTGLELGTTTPYAKFHQSDDPRSVIPQRKIVFIDGGPFETSRGASTSGRRQAWLNIINQFIVDKIEQGNAL